MHHRRMVRHFKWVLAHTSSTYPYAPWTANGLPSWVEELLRRDEFDVTSTYRTVTRLIRDGSSDDLGGFLEPNELFSGQPGAGVHNHVHRVIDQWERQLNPGDESAAMGDMETAPGNVFFWKLHGWIDEIFAAWQRANHQDVDQTPLKMDDEMIKCGPHTKHINNEILLL